MNSTARGKILVKPITLTSEQLMATDKLTRRFLIALSILGDVKIEGDEGRPGK